MQGVAEQVKIMALVADHEAKEKVGIVQSEPKADNYEKVASARLN